MVSAVGAETVGPLLLAVPIVHIRPPAPPAEAGLGSSRTEDILECSFEEFKLYLESKFEPWMNWSNYGVYDGLLNSGWDIDHIIPLSSANNLCVVKLIGIRKKTTFRIVFFLIIL